jgi:hypothetical protein
VWDNEGDGDGEVEIEVGETAEKGGVEGSVLAQEATHGQHSDEKIRHGEMKLFERD